MSLVTSVSGVLSSLRVRRDDIRFELARGGFLGVVLGLDLFSLRYCKQKTFIKSIRCEEYDKAKGVPFV